VTSSSSKRIPDIVREKDAETFPIILGQHGTNKKNPPPFPEGDC
jgi:hypothetical protein